MSTFTDWNGPQGGNIRASDLIQLANAYNDLVAKLNSHMADKTPGTSDVHGVKTYVAAEIQTAIAAVNTALAAVRTTAEAALPAATAATQYQTKIPNADTLVHSGDLAGYVLQTALNATLANYLRTNDLASQQVILDIKADIDAIELALNTIPFSMPILKATDYIEGLIHAVEQVKFTDKQVATHVGGADANGKYWLIGMQTEDNQAGTAYIKYTNTKPFTAAINFACSKVDGKYNGALSVVTDTVIEGLKFKLVYGTDNASNEHVYLAVQAPDWIQLNQLELYASGINFCPIGSEGCILPNGECHDIIDCFCKAGVNASNFNVPVGHVGEVVGWSKFDANGVPIDFPSSCHVCDGSAVDPAVWPELIAKGITTFPLVDYSIIVGSTTESKPDTDPMFAIRKVANGTGTITLNKESAEAGETVIVTLSAAPVAIHVLDNVSGTLITATQVDTTNVYTFTMPAADVTVIVDFA
jgi:hypothetical protein